MFFFLSHLNYVAFALLMAVGLFTVVVTSSRVKKLMGLGVFQTSVLLFYISLGYVGGAKAPILSGQEGDVLYSNPLPSVLMLTAIVVGMATMAVGFAMIVRVEGKATEV
ncbi:cation:proton antiporter subunit C [Anaplasma capra]|uniref:cation:proton antiporter subunit C n=1 Tax=Anaplasma capra TaxID=1562740 RepID=UPI0021D5B2A0|nr:cation:proton antiporter subunit C [Anaplasma capra]MCU7611520.1 cation:proton antiporter subunit C [Anaplasma capra]MCU7612041.1 cation:proton antiporter subunit C [Anaplasma capra]